MKRLIVLVIVISAFFGLNCFGQTTGVDADRNAPGNAYRINGISIAEDIGGVQVSRGSWGGPGQTNMFRLNFENFNDFSVTVVFEVESEDRSYNQPKATGTIVLRAREKRQSSDSFYRPRNYVLIVRQLGNE